MVWSGHSWLTKNGPAEPILVTKVVLPDFGSMNIRVGMCKMKSCIVNRVSCVVLCIYRCNVMVVMHGFVLSALELPLKTQKTLCLNSSA